MQVGDVVMVCDSSKIKAKYKLAMVEEVTVGSDGRVRSGVLKYTLVQSCGGTRVVRVRRSVQRLVLVLPIEEQSKPVEVVSEETSLVDQVKASNSV